MNGQVSASQPTNQSANQPAQPAVRHRHVSRLSIKRGVMRIKPHLASPRLASPRLASPHLASPHLASPRLASPRLASPHLASPRVVFLWSGLARFALFAFQSHSSPLVTTRHHSSPLLNTALPLAILFPLPLARIWIGVRRSVAKPAAVCCTLYAASRQAAPSSPLTPRRVTPTQPSAAERSIDPPHRAAYVPVCRGMGRSVRPSLLSPLTVGHSLTQWVE